MAQKRSSRGRRVGAMSTRGAKCKRACVSWKKVSGGKLRCKKFGPVSPTECGVQRERESRKGQARSR